MPHSYVDLEGNSPLVSDVDAKEITEEVPSFIEKNHIVEPLNDLEEQKDEDALKSNGHLILNTSVCNASEDDVVDRNDCMVLPGEQSLLASIEANPKIWMPPEPENWGDEVELSVANNDDDDDECYGGTEWAQPSSLGGSDDGLGMHNHHKEERQKAMMDAMNGQLKALVSQILASEGISLSMEDQQESWLDIISSISWEAAMLIKPDVNEGKSMDPTSYVKVKCIASGSPSQSKVIKGLVFKKNTAHKHMPTKITNARLLLFQGVLGQNAVGLSSFSSMEQEMDHLKLASEAIRSCSPNVVLVEKTVSRDIQECLLKKGITLVFDMKLHRMEKIARCTGSTIISSAEAPVNPQLKQCDAFHVEKFVEEHNHGVEGGKVQSKTLMFFEGCPKPLGCTILLRGAASDILKRVKHVVHYTVFAAYHLILETSFFLDQRAILSNSQHTESLSLSSIYASSDYVAPSADDDISTPISDEESASRAYDFSRIDSDLIPTENGSVGHLSASASLPIGQLISNGFDSSSLNSKEKKAGYLHISPSSDTLDAEINEKTNAELPESDDGSFSDRKIDQGHKQTNGVALDSKSILVLTSSLCRSQGTICEQSRLSRIKYYGNADMSLGRFLQDTLLNKNHSCTSCNEGPEGHAYTYTHQNGRLTALVRRLDKSLPGEVEGRIWMWTRCLKCKNKYGVGEPSRRVVMSNAAHSLSFGKFLELSFSGHSASMRISRCGHSLQRDCLRLFGLGSLVVMFMYSPVDVYTACEPSPVVEFTSLGKDDWLKGVARDLQRKVELLFSEVGRMLERMKHEKFPGPGGPLKEFYKADDLWRIEKSEFEAPLMKILQSGDSPPPESGQMSVDLPFLEWELLLELYAWDQRIHSVLSSAHGEVDSAAGEPAAALPESPDNAGGGAGSEEEAATAEGSPEVGAPESPNETDKADEAAVNVGSSEEESQRGRGFPESWIWEESGIQKMYREDLVRRRSRRFDFIRSYSPVHLSPMVNQEREWVHVPVGPDGHVISVSEDEISSLIACAVATWQNQPASSDERLEQRWSSSESSHGLRSDSSFHIPSFSSLDMEALRTSSFASFSSEDTIASAPAEIFGEQQVAEDLHPEVKVGGGGGGGGVVDCSVFCVHAKQFQELRRRCCPSEAAYLTSMSRCRRWDAQGGKSKAFFAKTLDDRIIIKQIKKRELESFLKFAPDYFKHVSHSLSSGNQTCLAKILGIYRVKQIKNGKELKTDLMVMENLLYGREISRVYDLKGAVFSRLVTDTSKPSAVRLDQNFVHDMGFSPFYLGGKSKRHLQRAIWNDTSFLTSINVMDYSLLVGVDERRREMVFGIIDYLRQYTWDKQLETWVKSSLVVPKNTSPTVVSPKDYKKRFRKFMSKHFLAVPDADDAAAAGDPLSDS